MAFTLLDSGIRTTNDIDNVSRLHFANSYLSKLRGVETGDHLLVYEGSSGLLRLCNEGYAPALVIPTIVLDGQGTRDDS